MADIAERIAVARKEAEALKEKIRLKKESLADITCEFCKSISLCIFLSYINKSNTNEHSYLKSL